MKPTLCVPLDDSWMGMEWVTKKKTKQNRPQLEAWNFQLHPNPPERGEELEIKLIIECFIHQNVPLVYFEAI